MKDFEDLGSAHDHTVNQTVANRLLKSSSWGNGQNGRVRRLHFRCKDFGTARADAGYLSLKVNLMNTAVGRIFYLLLSKQKHMRKYIYY